MALFFSCLVWFIEFVLAVGLLCFNILSYKKSNKSPILKLLLLRLDELVARVSKKTK